MSGLPFSDIERPIIDKTGLQGICFAALMWNPEEDFKAVVQQRLGLKFDTEKAAVQVLTVENRAIIPPTTIAIKPVRRCGVGGGLADSLSSVSNW